MAGRSAVSARLKLVRLHLSQPTPCLLTPLSARFSSTLHSYLICSNLTCSAPLRLCSALSCCELLSSILLCSAVLHSALPGSALLCSTAPSSGLCASRPTPHSSGHSCRLGWYRMTSTGPSRSAPVPFRGGAVSAGYCQCLAASPARRIIDPRYMSREIRKFRTDIDVKQTKALTLVHCKK